MVGSVKLLVASLCLGQVSSHREKLRGTRGENEKRRNLQVFTFEDEADETPMYDDYFALPTQIEHAGDEGMDDYFTHTSNGMQYNWQGSGGGGGSDSGSGGGGKGDEDGPEWSGKTSKFSKAIDKIEETGLLAKGIKAVKSAKSPPSPKGPEPKSSKSGKGLKSMKAVKYAKESKGTYAPGDTSGGISGGISGGFTDDAVDDVFGESRIGGAFETSTGAGAYSDYFAFGSTTGRTDIDDYFSVQTRSDVEGRSSFVETVSVPKESSGPQGRSGHTGSLGGQKWDDDYFQEDELVVFRPRPSVTIGGSVFMANPQSIMAPVVPDGSGNTLSIGAEYLMNEVLEDASNIRSQIIPIDVDSQSVSFAMSLDGYCDRIGPADQNSVQGYCFFTYTFIDIATQMISGAFTAQGIIVNAITPGQLTVTGGTGILTGATGLVEILPAAIDNSVEPPLLIQPASSTDPFNGVAGWAHFFEFDVDVLFFLPDLYAPGRR
mmetsp:Transcript_32045/g.75332  ORF Transcript_32045/g.75332 Transcript_32045/m.75332 type:complete len:490 (+) Transcript_32045:152-1621(+)